LEEYGFYIASQIHTRKQVYDEIHELIKIPGRKDIDRLKAMLSFEPVDRISSIRPEMIKFTLPYKEKLIELWKDDYHKNQDKSLASLVSGQDYEPLFNL